MENLAAPPIKNTKEGSPRQVGVELEFIGLSAEKAAHLVADVFKGRLTQKNKYRCTVETPNYGPFVVELDTIYAHDNNKAYNGIARRFDMAEDLAKLVGDLSSEFVPMEIISPPMPWTALTAFDDIVEKLRDEGAKGTNAAPYYAFGCQLNPEVARLDIDHILPIFRAFLIMEPWLREKSNKDLTRKLTNFADPFPKAFQVKVLDPDYAPSLEEFIDDYIAANPTRNRALDMLPLFKHLRPEKVENLGDERIKARPAYHYRLPDCPIGDTTWRVAQEWNRWVKVEELAANEQELKDRAAIHRANISRTLYQRVKNWLKGKIS